MIGKFIHWVSEELIIKRLSHNRTFQRFAVRLDDSIQKNRKAIEENATKVKGNAGGWWNTFVQDVQKEMNAIKQQQSQQQQGPSKK